MSEESNSPNSSVNTGRSPRRSFWLPLLGAGVLALGGFAIYQSTQTEDLRRQFSASQQDNLDFRAQLSRSDSELQDTLKSLRAQFEQTQQETTAKLAKAQNSAARHADLVAGRIAEKQEQQTQQLTEELGKVRESATEASTKLDGISSHVGSVETDVNSVKTEVSSAKSDIAQTKSELQRARGDMGEMSGLIATNSKEIQVLRDLGERNIFEFTVSRGANAQKVGDIQVTLKKADPKRNRFTLDVMADDKHVEKRDRTINEPVQFYTSRAHQPYELVVNTVLKDKVVGYLSTPKVASARNTTPTPAP